MSEIVGLDGFGGFPRDAMAFWHELSIEVPRGLIHRAAFEEWCAEHARAVAPVAKWILAHVRA